MEQSAMTILQSLERAAAASGSEAKCFEPGQLIQGRYEIVRLVGSGGLGLVVAARHAGFDDFVALKFLRPEYVANTQLVNRFSVEARASFRLRSEHVVRVMDVDLSEGTPFIAMELLDGADLRRVLQDQGQLEVEHAAACALQVCEALSAAHAIGIIHRDIKPENLFLSGALSGDDVGHLKVLDFGLSKVALVGPDADQLSTHTAVGTPPYMSPEQVRGMPLDERSDLWSLGCVLYELLTGVAVFDRESLMPSCAAVLELEPQPPSELRPAIPAGLSDVVLRCLRKAPEERFRDAAELAEALVPFANVRFAEYPARCRQWLNGEDARRRSSPSLPPPPARRLKHFKTVGGYAPLHSLAVVRSTSQTVRMYSKHSAQDVLSVPSRMQTVNANGACEPAQPVTEEPVELAQAAEIAALVQQLDGLVADVALPTPESEAVDDSDLEPTTAFALAAPEPHAALARVVAVAAPAVPRRRRSFGAVAGVLLMLTGVVAGGAAYQRRHRAVNAPQAHRVLPASDSSPPTTLTEPPEALAPKLPEPEPTAALDTRAQEPDEAALSNDTRKPAKPVHAVRPRVRVDEKPIESPPAPAPVRVARDPDVGF